MKHHSVLQKTAFGFDVSVWEFILPLLYGARMVIARPSGHKDPNYLSSVIEDQQITTLHFVPSMLDAFWRANLNPVHWFLSNMWLPAARHCQNRPAIVLQS